MKMLTKFELKLSRAKGVAFHPKRPWVLVSLHSSTIQLWDYRMGTLIDRFEDHSGPVRCVAFHPTQPLFVSGGDDYTIKVWSLAQRKCIFTLNGHLDYLRSVSFHSDLPWILSSSDDQTIRIWNWQNRQEIACLTGHNHYVMSSEFHPKEDLIVSSSLDQTIRVWDISGLRKRHSAPTKSFEEQLQRQQLPQQDIFGNVNATVKFVLEGHDKGVNFASFHPTLPLIVSGGEDRLVKVWRMSETIAWEVDSCRGHTGAVLSAIFHPTEELILSVGDDKTIRVWDLNKRTPVKQFRREHDRFWLIANHPSVNLFAACHDSGIMIFKLERERPAAVNFQNKLYFVNSKKQVQAFDYAKNEVLWPMLLLKKVGKSYSFMKSMAYNQFENSVLLSYEDKYALISLPKNVTGAIEPTDLKEGEGSACFISRNRFATFIKLKSVLEVRDTQNNLTKSIQLDTSVEDVLQSTAGKVILVKPHSIVHYDVQQRKEVGEFSANNVKYITWSSSGEYLAIMSKHTITVLTKTFEFVYSFHETIRIKSFCWDENDVLIYSTLNHIKYCLLNGDTGIIKTLDNIIYITKAQNSQVHCLTRRGEVEVIEIDPTEYRFKRALVNKNHKEVVRMIQNSNLVGQNIIAYLQKKGYPEVALEFVKDPETRFDLALESGDLNVALQEAQKLDSKYIWERLAEAALNEGNLEVVELSYQNLHYYDKLSFLYLIKGDPERLAKMQIVHEHANDINGLIKDTFFTGDIKKRCEVYITNGLASLAYLLAKSSGLSDYAQEILESAEGVDVKLPELGEQQGAIEPVASQSSWPLKETGLNFFDLAQSLPDVEDPQPRGVEEVDDFEDAEASEEEGWDLEEELVIEEPPKEVVADGEIGYWLRNSKTAASYIAAGSFDTGASMLNKQVGITEFEPLRERFFEVYEANKLFLPGIKDLPAMTTYVRQDNDEDNPSKFLPFIPGYDGLEEKLAIAFKNFKANNLVDAIKVFREIVYTIVVLTVEDEDEVTKCKDILDVCKEYILGLSIELERRKIEPTDTKRNLELAAYFTRVNMQDVHKVNALQVAMTQHFKHQNYSTASFFADELLKLVGSGPKADRAQKVKAKADLVASDAVEIDFDPYAEFDICAGSFTPIYRDAISEPLLGVKYKPEFAGSVCRVTQVSSVGKQALGLRLR